FCSPLSTEYSGCQIGVARRPKVSRLGRGCLDDVGRDVAELRLYEWSAKFESFNSCLLFRLLFANNGGMAITRRQREVYDFISRFVAEHQYSPSFEEIGKGLELTSLATVHKQVTNLEKKGLLTRDYNRIRSID